MIRSGLYSVVLIMLLFACEETNNDRTGEAVPEDPSLSHYALEVTGRIGIEMGDSNYVFASIASVVFSRSGDILVLDQGQHAVCRFSPEGQFIDRIGRQGSGPGEFQLPTDLTILGDGSLAVSDPFAGTVKLFDSEYGYMGDISGFFPTPPRVIHGADGNSFIGLKRETEIEENMIGYTLARWEEGNEPIVEYFTDLQPFDPTLIGPQFTENTVVFSADREGNVYSALLSIEDYTVLKLSAAGDTLLTIALEHEPVLKTDEEIQQEIDEFDAFLLRRAASGGRGSSGTGRDISAGDVQFTPEPYRFSIESIGLDSVGNIWVRRGTERCPFFDVYSPDGAPVFTASFPESELAEECADWKFLITPEGILAFDPDPLDYPEVLIVRLQQ